MKTELGKTLLNTVQTVPAGVVVFFTSYRQEKNFYDLWKSQGNYLNSRKYNFERASWQNWKTQDSFPWTQKAERSRRTIIKLWKVSKDSRCNFVCCCWRKGLGGNQFQWRLMQSSYNGRFALSRFEVNCDKTKNGVVRRSKVEVDSILYRLVWYFDLIKAKDLAKSCIKVSVCVPLINVLAVQSEIETTLLWFYSTICDTLVTIFKISFLIG